MSKKEKMLKGIKTPSRRKFFKAAAATSVVAAATLAMPSIVKAAETLKVQAACIFKVIGAPNAMLGIAIEAAAAAPVAAATLKNLRLEGVLIPFNVFSFLDIFVSLLLLLTYV